MNLSSKFILSIIIIIFFYLFDYVLIDLFYMYFFSGRLNFLIGFSH